MQSTIRKKLDEAIRSSKTGFCLGIDPDKTAILDIARESSDGNAIERALIYYSSKLLETVRPFASVVKFQSAYFESFGPPGVSALWEATKKARELGYLVILDAKRSDISTTMTAYGEMAFDVFGADILTVTPYMGFETVSALGKWLSSGCGIYVVLVSSNPSGWDIQGLPAQSGTVLFESVFKDFTEKSQVLGISESIGYVVGATKVESLSESVWAQLLGFPLLLPGVGAQGAEKTARLENMTGAGLNLFPISRGVTAQWGGNDLQYWKSVADRAKYWACHFCHE